MGDGTTQAFKNTPVTVTNLSGAKQVAMWAITTLVRLLKQAQ
ncbi:MAG: hypothetical protein IPG70_15980 [Moraxellaceae bacterium]|nr:hypothetical protein [Moraxellaceae bacterium]